MKLKDKKISIFGYVIEMDKWNQPIEIWAPLPNGENIWAYVRHLSGREIFTAKQVQSEEEMLFVINWRDDIDTTNVIEYQGKEYDVTRIDTFEGYKDDLKIYGKVRK